MNGYTMLADSYRKAKEKETSQEHKAMFDKEIRILDFLGTCDSDDIYRLFNSSAFNEIAKEYCEKAMRELEFDIDDIKRVRHTMETLFSEKTAKEIMEG